MSRPIKVITEPTWLRQVAQDSTLNVRDVAEIFGYTINHFTRAIRDGNFPVADIIPIGRKHRSRQWKVSTIRAEILRRNNLT